MIRARRILYAHAFAFGALLVRNSVSRFGGHDYVTHYRVRSGRVQIEGAYAHHRFDPFASLRFHLRNTVVRRLRAPSRKLRHLPGSRASHVRDQKRRLVRDWRKEGISACLVRKTGIHTDPRFLIPGDSSSYVAERFRKFVYTGVGGQDGIDVRIHSRYRLLIDSRSARRENHERRPRVLRMGLPRDESYLFHRKQKPRYARRGESRFLGDIRSSQLVSGRSCQMVEYGEIGKPYSSKKKFSGNERVEFRDVEQKLRSVIHKFERYIIDYSSICNFKELQIILKEVGAGCFSPSFR